MWEKYPLIKIGYIICGDCYECNEVEKYENL